MNRGGFQLDSDIEIIYHKPSGPQVVCQICNQPLDSQTPEQRQVHYDEHFSEPPQGSTSKQKTPPPSGARPKGKGKESDQFWHPGQNTIPPHNFSPGLIPLIRRALLKSHAKGNTCKAVLCHDRTVHIARDFWDITWGCGYRNFEMVCTALMAQQSQPMYFPLLDFPLPPGIRNLQQWIEDAWKDGFDEEGARDLNNKLVDTKKWIGTADLYVAFASRGIPTKLVDFDLRGKTGNSAEIVGNWIRDYFSPYETKAHNTVGSALMGASPVICTDKMPLILQNDGHSRTVIGYEVTKKGILNLLVFDPSKVIKKTLRNAGLANANLDASTVNGSTKYDDDIIILDSNTPKQQTTQEDKLDMMEVVSYFRLDPKKLGRKNQYQILYFPLSVPLTERERISRKQVTSLKVV